MFILGLDWDEGNWPKCGKHGLSKTEIEFVLVHEPMVMPDRSPVTTETRYNAVGRNEDGRHVFVVFTLRKSAAGTRIRAISARYMHAKEIERYEQDIKS